MQELGDIISARIRIITEWRIEVISVGKIWIVLIVCMSLAVR